MKLKRKEQLFVKQLESSDGLAVWSCKIGFANRSELSEGADLPMRLAVEKIFREVAGCDCDFCFSGWGGELTDSEKRVVFDNEDSIDH